MQRNTGTNIYSVVPLNTVVINGFMIPGKFLYEGRTEAQKTTKQGNKVIDVN